MTQLLKTMKTAIYVLIFAFLLHFTASAQHRIEVKDKAPLTVKVVSYNEQLVHFQTLTGTLDSIPTEQVSRIAYGDSLQVLVFPELMKGKRQLLTQAQFLEAMQASDYAALLHAYFNLYDVQFAATKSGLLLTPESRPKLAPLIRMFKIKQDIHLTISVHADSVGKAPVNQLLTERRAKAVSTELLRNGIAPSRFTMLAKGESEPFLIRPSLSRRIEITVDKVAKTKVLYAQKYIPPPPKKQETVIPVTKITQSEKQPPQTNIYLQPKKQKRVGVQIYGEVLYVPEILSKSWVNTDKGPGISQGFGGGIQFTSYLTPHFGLLLQGGYAKWQVQRRYFSNAQEVIYTTDQNLQRIAAQVGFRLYALQKVYLQAMGGGQRLTLTTQNSDTHPEGASAGKTQAFIPTFGGALGFELGESAVVDMSIQYQLSLNKEFSGTTEPLHYVGFRLGLGFHSKSR